MITNEQNDRLTKVSRGTPLGELMRRYWHPITPTSAMDENPVRKVRILGEDLVLYRDRSGDYGLIGPRCAHRLVHLELGIPEEHGLRCPYHGWCYDETGQCIDTPLESPHSHLKDNVKIGGYPVQELGGLIWGYLGPSPAPVLPPYDFLVVPNAIRQIAVTVIPCNWLQCHENSADPYHNTYLHGHFFKYQLERLGTLAERAPEPTSHRSYISMHGTDAADGIQFERDEYGFKKGYKVAKAKGAKEDGVNWFPYNIFPYFSRGAGGIRTQVNIRVPMDDSHTYHLSYIVFHSPDVEAPPQASVPYFEGPIFDQQGEPILDYVLAQDMAAWWSQGTRTERAEEVLGATDLAIIEFRKILEEQIKIVEEGGTPMGISYDKNKWGEILEFEPRLAARGATAVSQFRANYGAQYYNDDIDRYSPAIPLVEELLRRSAEAAKPRA